MATYIQGVTDYIPQFQPFQPDLNFYGNILQTKQTQYDTNWKSLNKMYGQYYNADLTRDENVAKKDQYLKKIEFDLKRVSQLDLSLEQNTSQATQIFKPFYEDKDLMNDMVVTMTHGREVGYGQSLKNAYEQKDRDRYWDKGIQYLNFKLQEFKEASSEEALTFQSSKYTPNVDINTKANEIATKAGISIPSVTKSPDGRYIISSINGEAATPYMQKLFESALGNDAQIQDVYKTQAYLNRKIYGESNAAQFNGDKNAAEMHYLEDSFKVLNQSNILRLSFVKDDAIAYNAKIADIEKQIKNKTASPQAITYLEQLKHNKSINDQVLAKLEGEQKLLNPDQNTTTTSTGFTNPYGDIKSLRFKVDNGMAASLMKKDLDEAAKIFAYKNAKQTITADPYALEGYRHANRTQERLLGNKGLLDAANAKSDREDAKLLKEHALKTGLASVGKDGKLVYTDIYDKVTLGVKSDGTTTDTLDYRAASNKIRNLYADNIAQPYLKSTLALIETLVEEGTMPKEEAAKILSYTKNPNISFANFNEKLKKHGNVWINNEVGAKDLENIQNKFNSWLGNNGDLSTFQDDPTYTDYSKKSLNFKDYSNYLRKDNAWRKDSSEVVEDQLRNDGFEFTEFLYAPSGQLRSEEQFYKAIADKHGKNAIKDFSRLVGTASYSSSSTTNSPISNKGFGDTNRVYDDNVNYKKMLAAATKIYSTNKPNQVKNKFAGLDKIGTLDGSGKFTMGTSDIFINTKAPMTESRTHLTELNNVISTIDFGDSTSDRISFKGIGKVAYDDEIKGENNIIGEKLLSLINKELSDPNTKMDNFKVSVAPIAANSMDKAAITFHPDPVWLKNYVKDTTDAGFIDANQYNDIITNGISLITNSKNLDKTTIYQQTFKSPLQTYIDNEKNGYTYVDPIDDNFSITIKKNEIGTGDYTIKNNYRLWDPLTNQYKSEHTFNNISTFGSELEGHRDMIIDTWSTYKEFNKELSNGRY